MNINATFIGQMIAFIVFVWFCMKFAWPPIIAVIKQRQKIIADGLNAADRAHVDLQLAQSKVTEQLKEAKMQATEIVEQANQRKAQLIEEAKANAMVEREKIIAQGKMEIIVERNRVTEDLIHQIASLSVLGAEKILQRSIDKAANQDIINQMIKEL